ncbi:DUF5681 domain-containing protein [Sphingomonas sp. Root710]|uniref:DUF5681 domain-containing protein n=1 Tax=Sphingomonas sp. Root710 TaxID=1736594 RepID=UPI00138F4F28|nr:DUF5681 domain-containing protein [Sphingomonas sp. Root710]
MAKEAAEAAAASVSETRADYEVGKNRPPRNRRFGEPNGNPPGRKKKARGFGAMVKRELASKVTLVQGGREIRLTKEELIVQTIVNGAIKGDHRKIDLLARHNVIRLVDAQSEAAGEEFDLDADGRDALQALIDLMGPPADKDDPDEDPDKEEDDDRDEPVA